MNKIDILIPIYNITGTIREEKFINTIKSINQDEFRICISDSGTDDRDVKNFSKQFDYYFEQSFGLFNKSKTINQGFKYLIESRIFIGLDADIIIPTDLRERIEKQFNNEKRCFGNFKYNFLSHEKLKNYPKFKSNEIKKSYAPYSCGESWITNKITFKFLKGFGEEFEGYGAEDVEMFQRVYQNNIKFQFLDISCISQEYTLSEKENNRRQKQNIINNKILKDKIENLKWNILLDKKKKPKHLRTL